MLHVPLIQGKCNLFTQLQFNSMNLRGSPSMILFLRANFRHRKLKLFTEEKRNAAYQLLRSFIEDAPGSLTSESIAEKSSVSAIKRGRFEDFADSSDEEDVNHEQNEVERFLSQRITMG